MLLPDEISKLIAYMQQTCLYVGSNAGFAADYSSFCGKEINPSSLKRLMNKHRYDLEGNGSALGTILGAGIGLITNAVEQSPTKETKIDTQREEILREIFGDGSYDDENFDDEDEDEGFSMRL